MNNRGFGLPEVLAFIGISLLSLVVIASFFKREYNNQLYKKSYDNIVEAKVDSKYYENLEMKLKRSAMESKLDTNIITLRDLKEEKLIDSLDDENGNSCDGYVLINEGNYNPYINCYEIYTSIGFNSKLLNH